MARFFVDTYAFIEYINGNEKYAPYFEGNELITSRFNLMELYYSTLLENPQLADTYFESFSTMQIDFNDETLKKAMRFRKENKKLKLSYADCIGYQISLEEKAKFLTGDKGFKNMENTEYVK
ncbi:MAG: hypothetical protein COV47_05360 [Candidatus Diapherotrites archaeon CG11_big_fil_rev_8_21_14_0_20_37_9]|nr:MAG: hypothetical protein COV47_05360 [Candidatus Diapherotrites archaeon CG11_big_fil_rev_8_21_14_0_20_37_9]